MPRITVRRIERDEAAEVLFELATYAFNPSPPLPDREERLQTIREREGVTYIALYEDEMAVAVAASTGMTQQVRGRLFPAGGVWGVATRPAARRKGYSKRVLTTLLTEVREQGQTFSCLYPFRESFYERLGYTTFPLVQHVTVQPSALLPIVKMGLPGHVEKMSLVEGNDIYRQMVERLRAGTHGMALFDHWTEAMAAHWKYWLAIARVDGEPVGFMFYDIRGKFIDDFKFRAIYFYYLTPVGKYLLLEWIGRHTDQAVTAEIWLPPAETPETWLSDLRLKREAPPRAPMGRVLDVEGLAGMPAGLGQFSARVSDSLCPWNEGIWRFESVGGTLQVSRAQKAECDLTVNGLSALVYGTHALSDYALRGWGNPPPELQARMRAMFASTQPHLHEYF